MSEARINRLHKADLFTAVFAEKKDLLSLYNAINGSHYDDPEQLEITTIGDVLYMGMKNDISFLIDSRMNLYEAQSTPNPNMPLRGLFYFTRLYEAYVKLHKLDIYSKSRLSLPTPSYVVFYNGQTKRPEVSTLRLSDSFAKQAGAEPCLECTALVLNINVGQNQNLMAECRKLYEYAFLIEAIRRSLSKGLTLEAAVNQAVDECILDGILEDFLTKHRAEVRRMILEEYDAELHISCEKKLSFEEGEQHGKKLGEDRLSKLNLALIAAKRYEDLERAAKDPAYRNLLYEEFNLL